MKESRSLCTSVFERYEKDLKKCEIGNATPFSEPLAQQSIFNYNLLKVILISIKGTLCQTNR
jgi:hypothetical protein